MMGVSCVITAEIQPSISSEIILTSGCLSSHLEVDEMIPVIENPFVPTVSKTTPPSAHLLRSTF